MERFAAMDSYARTTIVRLQDGALFVHSPCPLSGQLQRQLAARACCALDRDRELPLAL